MRRNITLGETDLDDEAVERALRAAGAWFFVSTLEGRLDHVIGESGGKLSGGEGQRLALARAIVREPFLLVLDEATANLDAQIERDILAGLRRMCGRTTILTVSHRPARAGRGGRLCRGYRRKGPGEADPSADAGRGRLELIERRFPCVLLHVLNYGWPHLDGYTARSIGLIAAQRRTLGLNVAVADLPLSTTDQGF